MGLSVGLGKTSEPVHGIRPKIDAAESGFHVSWFG